MPGAARRISLTVTENIALADTRGSGEHELEEVVVFALRRGGCHVGGRRAGDFRRAGNCRRAGDCRRASDCRRARLFPLSDRGRAGGRRARLFHLRERDLSGQGGG